MVSGYLSSKNFPRVDNWSTDPRVLGRHSDCYSYTICRMIISQLSSDLIENP